MCLHCGVALESSRAFYCSNRCRQRAYRRRKRSMPPDSYLFARGLRGRAPMGVLTQTEERADLLTIRPRAA